MNLYRQRPTHRKLIPTFVKTDRMSSLFLTYRRRRNRAPRPRCRRGCCALAVDKIIFQHNSRNKIYTALRIDDSLVRLASPPRGKLLSRDGLAAVIRTEPLLSGPSRCYHGMD